MESSDTKAVTTNPVTQAGEAPKNDVVLRVQGGRHVAPVRFPKQAT